MIAVLSEVVFVFGNLGTSLKGLFAGNNSKKQGENGKNAAKAIPKKTLNSKTYKLKDGKYKTEFFAEAVNYKKDNGQLAEINNTFVKSGKKGFAYENKANDFKVYFAKNTSKKELVKIESKKRSIEWKLLDTKKADSRVKNNTITYKDVFKNVDLKYIMQNNKVKEELILQKGSTTNKYNFKLNMENVYYQQEKDGSLGFYDKSTKEKVWSLENPYMYDAKGAESEKVTVNIKDDKGTLYLVLEADKEWLQSKDRSFPVVIDPTADYQPGWKVGQDTFVSSTYPYSNYFARTYLKAGYDSTHGDTISFIKFSEADNIPRGAKIYEAKIGAYQYLGGTGGNISLYQVYSSWSPSQVTYNSMPNFGEPAETSAYSYNKDWVTFYITALAQRWTNNIDPNNGVALSYDGYVKRFYSSDAVSDQPKITIIYDIDTAPPGVDLRYPQNNEIVRGGSYIEANTWDNNGVSKTEYYIDGRLIGTGGEGIDSIEWNSAAYSNGNHTITVRAYDYAGNRSEVSRNVLVDNDAPQVSIASPTTGSTLTGKVNINMNASDQTSGIGEVILYINGNQVSTFKNAPYQYIWDSTSYPAGEYTIDAVAYDKAGNEASAKSVDVKLDHLKPSVQIIVPNQGDYLRRTVPVWFATNDDLAVIQARYYVDGILQRTTDYPWFIGDDKFDWDTTNFSDGTHTLQVTVKDMFGRESSASVQVVVDNTDPTGNIIYPKDGDPLRMTVPFEVTAGDLTSGVDRVEFYVNNKLADTVYAAPYIYEWDTTKVPDGKFTLTAKIYDRAGNMITRQVVVDADNTAPIPVITAPANNAVVKGLLNISGSALDNLAVADIRLKIEKLGGGYEKEFGITKAAQGNWTWDTTAVRDGEYIISLDAYDTAGNNAVAKVNVVVKNIPDALGVKGFSSYHDQKMTYFSAWVNSVKGNLTLKKSDLAVAGRGLPVTIERVYNNQSKSAGLAGSGWHLNTGIYLSEYSTGNIEILDATGTKLLFTKNQDNTYKAPTGIYDTLAKNNDGTYILTYQNKIKDAFDSAGNLVKSTNLAGNCISYDYDDNGKLSAITDDSGRVYSLTYNTDGLLASIIDPANQSITYTYDQGNLVKVVDQAGKTVSYNYDANHNLTGFTDGTGNQTQFTYSGDKVTSFTDPLGNSTAYTYNTVDKAMTVTDPLNNKTVYTNNTNGNPTSVKDPLGNTTSFSFDENNNLTSTTDANNKTIIYQYDNQGNMTSSLDTLSRLTSYTYDVNNKPITIVNPDITKTQYTYDEKGNLLNETDALGKYTTYTYDQYGNRTGMTDANGAITTYAYDQLGNVTSITDAQGKSTQIAYDILSRPKETVDPQGNSTAVNYDALGNKTSVTDANGATTTYQYDANGQVLKETDPIGATTSYAYDGNGNNTTVTDAKGAVTISSYDVTGNKAAVTDPLGNIISFQYDAAGNMTGTKDAEGRTTTAQYDKLGQVISETSPEGNKSTYNYDSAGNVASVLDPNGGAISYTYDKKDQVTEAKNPLGFLAKWEYDANGNTTKATDFNGQSNLTNYDAVGNVTAVKDALGNSNSYVYDAVGNLLNMTDSRGQKTEYTYDANGRVVAEKNPAGNTVKYEFDKVGNLAAETDAAGNRSAYGYDANGNVTKEVDPYGNNSSFTYDKTGNQTSEKDPLGNVTKYGYDANGQMTNETDPLGLIRKYAYSPGGDLSAETNSRGLTASYKYDSQGNITEEKDPLGNAAKYSYDGTGNMTTETDALGNKSAYKYDSGGNMTEETNPLGHTTKYGYDANGEITKETDPLGYSQKYDYNANGDISKETDQLGNSTTYAYDPAGNLNKETDPLGKTISYEYDAAGNLTSETDARGNTTHYTFDANGNIKQEIDPQGNITNFNFDANDNLTSTTDALGNTETFAYDGNGNITSSTDANGLVTYYSYDANDNLATVTDPAGSVTKYGYDGEGNLLTMTDPDGKTTTYTYDANDNLASITDPMGNKTTYTYDANGNMTSMTNANGQSTTYTFDGTGQLTQITYPGGATVQYGYNAAGDLTSKTDATGTTNYSYDATGRLTKLVNPDGTTVEYIYDAGGNLIGKKVNGVTTNYTYDDNGRIISITDGNGNTIWYTYDKAGNRTSIKYPNGVTITMAYDQANRLIKITTTNASGTVLSTSSYTYEKNGNRVEITNEKGTYKYAYDKSNQLISATYPDGRTVQYTYDKRGNRTSVDVTVAFNGVQSNGQKKGIDTIVNDIVNGGKVNGNKNGLRDNIQYILLGYGKQGNMTGLKNTVLNEVNGFTVHIASYTYNNANQLTSADYPILPITYNYTYDANGNMTGDGFKTYQYDSENRLINITDKTQTITYTYDDKGLRTSTAVNGKVTKFHYDDGKVAYETDGSGTVTKRYTYDAEGKLISFTYNGATYYYNFNGHGDIIGLTDASGNQVATYDYDAYGNITDVSGDSGLANANPYRYAGYRYDDETGLYYLISRYYDPNTGRFLSKDNVNADPINPITQNLYSYAGNNPINYIDPDGHSFFSFIKKKASQFIGSVGNAVRTVESVASNIASNVSSAVNNAVHSVVAGIARAKVNLLRVGKQVIKITRYGARVFKAKVRGMMARVIKKFSSVKKSFNRIKNKAVMSLYNHFRKNKVTVKNKPKSSTVVNSNGRINYCASCHSNKRANKTVAYIFYLPEWENEAKDDRKRLAAYYSLKGNQVILTKVNNADELTNAWNGMGIVGGNNVNIATVVIDTHADATGLGFSNGDSFDTSDISNLGVKNIKKLMLYGCNSGHLDYKVDNPAAEFAKKVNGGSVLASDGTVEGGKPRILGLFGSLTYKSDNDKEFRRQRANGSTRDNAGWIVYQYKNNKIHTSKSLGKNLTLTQMLINIDKAQ